MSEQKAEKRPITPGKIKAARRLNSKPLTWLAFNRAVRSERVPRSQFLRTESMRSVALIVVQRAQA